MRQLAITPVDEAGIQRDWCLGKNDLTWKQIPILLDETRQVIVDDRMRSDEIESKLITLRHLVGATTQSIVLQTDC